MFFFRLLHTFEKLNFETMKYDGWKFVLDTCASSECEVTGKDIEITDNFEYDLTGGNIKPGMGLFDPKKVTRKYFNGPKEETVYPIFNFKVIEINEEGMVLRTSFIHSSYTSKFEISFANPKHGESFWFGRYCYSFDLKLVRE